MSKNDAGNKPPSIPVCGIGASAGGVEALQQFFNAIPSDLGMAYVVIVHLAPDRKSELPTIISRCTKMPVIQVADNQREKLSPDTIYVIAPDRKLEITDTSVSASAFDQPRGQRTAIDLFFRSLAEAHGDGFAVVLSGSGSDGALGAKAVKESGGVVLVQDPRSAAHPGMPGSVIATGAADIVLPVPALAAQLAELSRNKSRILPVVRMAKGEEQISEGEEKSLKHVLDLLKRQTGNDFSKYKRATVLRRLSRRMQLSHQTTISDYLRYCRENAFEVPALLSDLLISVTTFFRDPESWAALQQQVIRTLVENTESEEQIRVWVPGCATGEEAYTLAILFHEEFHRRKTHRNLIIFASDVDEKALAVAREGSYPAAISADVSEDRLSQFFRREDDHYRVLSEIRDTVVFASHSLLRDPPFSRLDLISCRNLLIYLDRDLQTQVMGIFRYACRDSGYLFLGASEMAEHDSFQEVDKKNRIYMTRPNETSHRRLPQILASPVKGTLRPLWDARPLSRSAAGDLHLAALESASAPSLVLDERWNVLHLSLTASRFLLQSGGPPTRRVTDLVRPELRDELEVTLSRAFETPEPQLSRFISVTVDREMRRVAIHAQRIRQSPDRAASVLITFLDAGSAVSDESRIDQAPEAEVIRDLQEKMRTTQLRFESMRDDNTLANEDLRAANEELQSLNEEYRSTTEELETSKEELQSINEELQTVNNELKIKLEEVSRANSDLENLMGATNVATLFLNTELRIKRFTPQLAGIFNIKTRDLDRPIGDLTHSLDYRTFEQDAETVLANLQSIERETRSADGRTFAVRLSPYRTSDRREIDGVVVTFIDMTVIKKTEADLRESERKLEAELNVTRRLHGMIMEVATASTMQDALNQVLFTSIELHGAEFGHIQLFDVASNQLRIVAHHGFSPVYLKFFETMNIDDESASGRALRARAQVHIADITTDPSYAKNREVYDAAGYRSVHSTPLISRTSELVGILSVHFREPHPATERDRQFAGLLAQQAADLIESRAQQDRLTRLNEALSKRTGELEASEERLSRQAAELLDQDRHRQEFLAALGHELRNPMAAMQASLTVMSAPDEISGRALAIMRRQAVHMTRLINDLLDVTRVTRGRLRIERDVVDLNTSVLAAVETVRQQAESKGLKLEYRIPLQPLYVSADPERLAQVFDNLLRNAITYTEKGLVSVNALKEGAHARVRIRDTGVGVDPENSAALFEPYYQASRGKSGLGLGLTVVKAIVEAHGGTIALSSDGVGKGTEFTFTLPLAHAAPKNSDHDATKVPARRRVLVVDDQPDVADTLAALLEQLGQEVRVAYSAGSALAAVREQPPHVAFLDLSMPDMDGSELARLLRHDVANGVMTLVAISGKADSAAFARHNHFDHYLLKPASKEEIASLLSALPVTSH